jgi:putative ABC transport system permease protein
MSSMSQDFKYGFRVLAKNPGFTAVAVLVLALGIGANSAIFSVVNAVLLQPLPFPQSSRLVRVWHTPPQKSFPGMTMFSVSAANYLDWEKQNDVFEQMAIYEFRGFNLTGTTNPEMLAASAVSQNFFSVLRTAPMLGRTFTPEEDQPGRGNVILLSYRYWQEHFGSDHGVVGRNVNLDGQSYQIIGVMPAKFRIPSYAQVWTPIAWTDQQRAVRGEHHAMVIARLKPGVDQKQAQAEMSAISARLEQQYPEDDRGWGALVLPLQADLVSDVRPALLVLLGAVAFVLLIACANVANLMLAKTLARQKEIAIRAALGASRTRILRQILCESVLLSLAGGAFGLFFAHFGVQLIVKFAAEQLPHFADIGLDGWVLGFTLVVSVLSGVLAGLVPAWRLTHANVNDALKQGLGRTDSDSGGHRARGVLVVSEVALSLVLLIGAGLMIRSLWKLRNVDPGFDVSQTLKMDLSVSGKKFPTPQTNINFYDAVMRNVRAVPGVTSAGLVDTLPLSMQGGSNQPVAIEGRPVVPMADQPEVAARLISPGYLQTMRIPVLRGRDLNDADVAGRPSVVLINQAMARRLWPNEDPLGKHLKLTFFPDVTREVVGIIGDTKDDALNITEPAATLYWPVGQINLPASGGWRSFGLTLVVRSASNPVTLVPALSRAIHTADKDVPLMDIMSLEQVVADSLSQQKFNMTLLASFAALAVLLAGVGIYSVLSYAVRRRVREIGIRMALGAQLRDVLRLILLDGMRPTLLGLVIGVIGALALGRVLSSLVYGISTSDLPTYAGVATLLAAVGLFACVIPAYRATRVDPLEALRDE